MKNPLLFILFFLLLASCAFETTPSKNSIKPKTQDLQIKFYSTDKVLVGIICNSMEKNLIGKCLSDIDLDSMENSDSIKQVYIETQIRQSSSDYFLNSGKSLLTLTLGIFLTNSAEVDFLFYARNRKETVLENASLSSFGRTGYWGVLPIYTGFIATNLGTILNSYRKPDHLQKYCLYEDPGKFRQTLEAKKEDYCKDYEVFLQESFYKIENDFFQIIQEAEAKQ